MSATCERATTLLDSTTVTGYVEAWEVLVVWGVRGNGKTPRVLLCVGGDR